VELLKSVGGREIIGAEVQALHQRLLCVYERRPRSRRDLDEFVDISVSARSVE